MSETEPPDDDERPGSAALVGVVFVVILVVGAIWLMNRMQLYATLGDCAFTHAPQCRELLGR